MNENSRLVRGAVIAAALAAAGAARAHHSVAANFDGNREVEIRGTVVDFKLRSPHSSIVVDGIAYVDGTQRSDSVERWEIESSAAPSLMARGIESETFSPGDEIIVIGSPHRDAGLTRANGSTFFRASGEAVGAQGAYRFHPQLRRAAGLSETPPFVEVTATGVERVAGRWQPPFQRNGDGSALPLNETGLAAWRAYDQKLSPANTCEPMSIPVVFNAPAYFVDVRFAGETATVHNQAYDITRTVPLDGSEAPADAEGRFGIVSGRVDGETLVIESRDFPPSKWGLGAATQVNGGGADVPSSDEKVLTERYSVTDDAQTLLYEYTLYDPVYMSRPYTASIELARVPDETPMYTYDCEVDAASMFSRAPGQSLIRETD